MDWKAGHYLAVIVIMVFWVLFGGVAGSLTELVAEIVVGSLVGVVVVWGVGGLIEYERKTGTAKLEE